MVLKRILKKKTNETIKRELLNSLQENNDVEGKMFNKTANNVNNFQGAIETINC